MYKIYSRPRICIPKSIANRGNRFKNPKTKKLIKIVIILTIAMIVVKTVLEGIYPIFDSLCEEKAKLIATIISNEQATKVMKEHSYDEMFKIEKDKNNNITMINSNIIAINEIISDIAIRIQEEIENRGREEIEIAIGSFTGSKLLSGMGPGIKIRISSSRKCRDRLKK